MCALRLESVFPVSIFARLAAAVESFFLFLFASTGCQPRMLEEQIMLQVASIEIFFKEPKEVEEEVRP
jgi:hypothetical protein